MNKVNLPFVCVVCPTYNRRAFLPLLLYQYEQQNYPKHRSKLIILEDTPNVISLNDEDFKNMGIRDISSLYYVYSETRIGIHEKRNKLNALAINKFNADYIICMDDDDIYSKERITDVINVLERNKTFHMTGSNESYIYHVETGDMYKSIVNNPNYSSNNAMGYRKEYITKNKNTYDTKVKRPSQVDEINYDEEYSFTRGFTNPLVQMDSEYIVLTIAHTNNTVSKESHQKRNNRVSKQMKHIIMKRFFDTKKIALLMELFPNFKF